MDKTQSEKSSSDVEDQSCTDANVLLRIDSQMSAQTAAQWIIFYNTLHSDPVRLNAVLLEISRRMSRGGISVLIPEPPHSTWCLESLLRLFCELSYPARVFLRDTVRMMARDPSVWDVLIEGLKLGLFRKCSATCHLIMSNLIPLLKKLMWTHLVETDMFKWLVQPLRSHKAHDIFATMSSVIVLFQSKFSKRAIKILGRYGLNDELAKLWMDHARGRGSMVFCDHTFSVRYLDASAAMSPTEFVILTSLNAVTPVALDAKTRKFFHQDLLESLRALVESRCNVEVQNAAILLKIAIENVESAPESWFQRVRDSLKATFAETFRSPCSWTECSKVETQELKFKMCAGCQIVRYCCKKCQRLHWKAEHKRQCQKVNINH